MANIQELSVAEARRLRPQLAELLLDCVNDGASIGFLRPMTKEHAEQFWEDTFADAAKGQRLIFAAMQDERLVGSVQLGLCTRPNGMHRAEVQKLLVHTGSRRQGIGQRLMEQVEARAREIKRSMLYLDTEPGKPAERMYQRLGWSRAGEIPNYAMTPDGELHPSAFYYKLL